MYSSEIKVGHMYYGYYDDGSFAATFYVMSKHEGKHGGFFNCLTRYYPNDEYKILYYDFKSFDYDDDTSDEEWPEDNWLADCQEYIPHKIWGKSQRLVEEYGISFIHQLFTKGLPE